MTKVQPQTTFPRESSINVNNNKIENIGVECYCSAVTAVAVVTGDVGENLGKCKHGDTNRMRICNVSQIN